MSPKSIPGKLSSSNSTEPTPATAKAPTEKRSTQESRQKPSDDWKEWEQSTKKMLKHSEVYSKMDEIMDDYAKQKERADLNEKMLKEFENYKKVQINDFAKACNEWKEEEKKLRRNIEDAQSRSRDVYSVKMKGLQDELEAATIAKQLLQSQLDTTNQDCKEAKHELELWRKKIQRYDEDLAILDDTALETQYANLINVR